MNRDKNCPILAKPSPDKIIYQTITSVEAGWHQLNFMARTMKPGQKWTGDTGKNEYLFVLLGEIFWLKLLWVHGKHGMEGKMYSAACLMHYTFPQDTNFEITPVDSILDIACGWCTAKQSYPSHYITPSDVVNMGIEYRGGDNASRQINRILPPRVTRLSVWFALKSILLQGTGVLFRRTNMIQEKRILLQEP